ncbi:MAG TPA: hypothetical protein DFJ59_00585 [Alphaproteobacteria bacterium]|nr:hypothetical protein [Alphaproteobacteria bacterium]
MDEAAKISKEVAGILRHPLTHRSENEKLILQLIRHSGAMPKADIARSTDLSAQAVSVNINRLLDLGLVHKKESQRGKVGQPSTPISLSPGGVYSLGVKIGRQTTQVLLINFVGEVCADRKFEYSAPVVNEVLSNIKRMIDEIVGEFDPEVTDKIIGVGLAQPFRLDEWSDELGVNPALLDDWAEVNAAQELQASLKRPIYSINDATAACLAEMVVSPGANRSSFLYIYIGTFVGGGLVIDGRLHQGASGNAGALGSQLVFVPGKVEPQQLISVASRFHLERDLQKQEMGIDSEGALESAAFVEWVENAAFALAQTIISSSALVELDRVVLDSSLPDKLLDAIVASTERALEQIISTGVTLPIVEKGHLGSIGSGLGGALLPICSEFTMMNQTAEPSFNA